MPFQCFNGIQGHSERVIKLLSVGESVVITFQLYRPDFSSLTQLINEVTSRYATTACVITCSRPYFLKGE